MPQTILLLTISYSSTQYFLFREPLDVSVMSITRVFTGLFSTQVLIGLWSWLNVLGWDSVFSPLELTFDNESGTKVNIVIQTTHNTHTQRNTYTHIHTYIWLQYLWVCKMLNWIPHPAHSSVQLINTTLVDELFHWKPQKPQPSTHKTMEKTTVTAPFEFVSVIGG